MKRTSSEKGRLFQQQAFDAKAPFLALGVLLTGSAAPNYSLN
jgi:hypothetical protein